MLADPTFDGLEELKTTLADLKGKRDSLQARLEQIHACGAHERVGRSSMGSRTVEPTG